MYPVTSVSLQFFCITHEIAPASTETSHIADFLAPFKAYWVVGRSAKATPQCKPEVCLYYTWKVISRECHIQCGRESDLAGLHRVAGNLS